MTKRKLTAKQVEFCEAYLADPKRNASRAYQQVYPVNLLKTATERACRLLKKQAIQAYIHGREQELALLAKESYEVTQDRILKELAAIAFSNITDIVAWDADGVKLKPLEQLSDEAKAAIDVLDLKRRGANETFRLKMHDKRAALVALGKYLGIFKEKLDLSVNADLKSFLAEIDGNSRQLVKPD